jgi:hypothetical protein
MVTTTVVMENGMRTVPRYLAPARPGLPADPAWIHPISAATTAREHRLSGMPAPTVDRELAADHRDSCDINLSAILDGSRSRAAGLVNLFARSRE